MRIFGLNKRETVLVILLLLLLFGYGIYKLVYSPQKVKLDEMIAERERTAAEKDNVEIKIAAIPRLVEEIETAEAFAEKNTPPFFSDITQENLIVLLDEKAKEASFGVKSYSFSQTTAMEIPIIEEKEEALNYGLRELTDNYLLKYGTEEQKAEMTAKLEGTEKAQLESDKAAAGNSDEDYRLAKTSVGVAFDSTYFQLFSYLTALESYHKTIVVDSLNISGQSGANLTGALVIDFYMLPKIFPGDSDSEETEWGLSIPGGKDNPFNYNQVQQPESADENTAPPTASAADGQNTDTSIAESQSSGRATDFFIIARSSTADMPSLTIGAAGDSTGATYIRETFDGEKTATIEFTEENGTYYFSSKTDLHTYPNEGRQEFVPKRAGNISFVAYSSRRSGERDTNKIIIRVINNTRLQLNTAIDGDDFERPRVDIVKQ